ncbi:hypothetical protein Xmlh_14685 [Xanthomonas axonopodis pv. melhusii]|uniref:Uncharacterized protein n=1 Tax=Xanthomonas axonopodis pv. melhusii TaxID=487834 RepID=A0A1T1NXX7_9XANT|nr:hypothetical protein Xmlh_14685 [Xanthomonas axonopodis pv. melhusii]
MLVGAVTFVAGLRRMACEGRRLASNLAQSEVMGSYPTVAVIGQRPRCYKRSGFNQTPES